MVSATLVTSLFVPGSL